MKKIDYTLMSDQELKQYMLTNRDEQEAFYAYMDRRHSRPKKTSIAYDDPNWEEKIVSEINSQIEQK